MRPLFLLLLTILMMVTYVAAVTYQELLDKATDMKENNKARYECAVKNMLLRQNTDAVGMERVVAGSPERMIQVLEGKDEEDYYRNKQIYDYLVAAENFTDMEVYVCTRNPIFASRRNRRQ